MNTPPDTPPGTPQTGTPAAAPDSKSPASGSTHSAFSILHSSLAQSAQPAIAVENLRCGYDGRTVLDKINFNVPRGQIFFIVGGSGCGKSTLLKHMIGLHQPTLGHVSYFGENFTAAPLARRRQILKTFGVLYQSAALWSSLTIRENVALPLEEYTTLTKRERELVVAHKLAQVNLSGFEDYYPSEISGGMKKRAGLARALALDPQIVFFDEPSAGLDPVSSRNLDELLLSIRENLGTTLIIVSHELDSIYGIADRILMLDRDAKGAIADGPPRQLATRSTDPRVRTFLQRCEDTPRTSPATGNTPAIFP